MINSANSEKNHQVKQSRKLSIVILGGGTAGWMTANLMAEKWQDHNISITLIESPSIGVIGVGEGSTPQLKTFFDKIGVTEKQWMPECNATYKNGILFKNWSTRPGFECYFHPFTSLIDAHTAPAFVYNTQYRRKGVDVDCHPDRFFLSAQLAKQQKSPVGEFNFPFDIGYGYHFDAVLLGKYLGKVAMKKGVEHISAQVAGVNITKNGEIHSLALDDKRVIKGDFFVDCSGFNSVLLQKTLKVPFISFKENLFNDSAVTISVPREENPQQKINSQTISTAMKYGWAWDIPLTNRTGNGYVYSSDYCSAEQAELELREKLSLVDADVEVRHLKMKVGRVEKHWHKNCVAIGLSQGFIEPLEATALHFVQESIEGFIDSFSAGDFSNAYQNKFNEKMNNRFDGIRDYIVAHYRFSSRDDTEYWRKNSENPNISNNLKKIVQCWVAGDDLNKALVQPGMVSFYPPVSWHAILAGYGIFPEISPQKLLTEKFGDNAIAGAHKYDLAHIDQFIQRCSVNFADHQQFISDKFVTK
jgi:hypothetical protein